jgi:hypothetical protein
VFWVPRPTSIVSLAVALACAASCNRASTEGSPVVDEAPRPESRKTEPAEDIVKLRGTIASIRLENVNKARGHYTYNVEIELRHDGIDVAGTFDPRSVPNPLTIRVDKAFWDSMSEAEREAAAPNGPQQLLTPQRWADLEVGQPIELDVTFSSPSLAHRIH